MACLFCSFGRTKSAGEKLWKEAVFYEIFSLAMLTEMAMTYLTRKYKHEKVSVVVNFCTARKIAIPHKAILLIGNSELPNNGFIIYKTL